MRDDPGLAPQLRGLLDGDPLPVEHDLRGDRLIGDFEGSAAGGSVLVHVSGRTRRCVSVYLQDLGRELPGQVTEAANRAMAAAELGRADAVPLDDELDATLTRLDGSLSAVAARLDDVDATLDGLLRDLD